MRSAIPVCLGVAPGRCGERPGGALPHATHRRTYRCQQDDGHEDASWEVNEYVTSKVWTGGWHQWPSDTQAFRSITLHMQARFQTTGHLTQIYVGCSKWVDPRNGFAWQLPCRGAP